MAKRTGVKQKKTMAKIRPGKAAEATLAVVSDADSSASLSARTWNRWLAGIHAFQGLLILLLASGRVFPVQTSYLTPDPLAAEITGHPVLVMATRHLFDIHLAYLIAGFFFVAAIAHGLMATAYRSQYEAELQRRTNTLRWIGFAAGVSFMVLAIGLVGGIADLSTLILLSVLVIITGGLGLVLERSSSAKQRPSCILLGLMALAAAMPWAIFAIYTWGITVYGSGSAPGYVYGIYASMLVLGGAFVAVGYLQTKKTGKWAEYAYAERAYMLLGIVTPTVLAWQLYVGALRP